MNQRHRNVQRRAASGGRADRGFMLIEALVALLIFAFGVLGIVGLQASMTKAQTQSRFRADASILAQQAIGAMWADTTNLASYATASCAGYARCNEWATRVSTALPNGAATVDLSASPVVVISITWTPPNEQLHTYTTTSAIAVNPP
jgi:type IV pilus assembly protein PilV